MAFDILWSFGVHPGSVLRLSLVAAAARHLTTTTTADFWLADLLHASSPQAVNRLQLSFASFAVINLQRDLPPQECARAGRAKKKGRLPGPSSSLSKCSLNWGSAPVLESWRGVVHHPAATHSVHVHDTGLTARQTVAPQQQQAGVGRRQQVVGRLAGYVHCTRGTHRHREAGG